ncbi:MAG TPA: zinc ribbon domain-containing protein [Acidimicrobiales bacterium]|nr:zinc ribbon domain-containing protein [Acidimicrobiales bacterium]
MPTLQYFPPTEEAGAIVGQIPGVRFTEVPVLAVDGPDGALGPEAAGAVMHLHMTMIDEDKTRAFWMQVALTLREAAQAPGLIRFLAIADGLSNDAVAWWRTVEDARAFAAGAAHRSAVGAMDAEGFQYTHFAGLWQLVEARKRHAFCDACGTRNALPADRCAKCGAELADVFRQRSMSPAS